MPTRLHAFHGLLRQLARTPGFTLVAVLTLAIGIGANVAIFSLVHAVLIEALPFPEPERLVAVWHTAPGLDIPQFEQSDGTYVIYRRESRTLEELGIYDLRSVSLTGDGAPERLDGSGATASAFEVLRVPPALGRRFVASDERAGAEPVVLLSHALWSRRFGGARDAVGTTVRLDGETRRIVGVMPAGFRFPSAETELWVPITIDPAKLAVGNFNYRGIGRLRPGATPQAVERELSALVRRIPEEFPDEQITPGMLETARFAAKVHPLRDDVVGDVERLLWILLGSVGVILLIACANVANLFLVRAEARQREVAVRTALGATRGQIARAFLGESTALALAGGALGVLLAGLGLRVLLAAGAERIPRLEEVGIDAPVLAFALAVSLVAALLCGGFAGLRYGAPDLVPALKEGGRGDTAGRGRHRARHVLVAAQMALALVLLAGSGLMVRSFWRLRHVEPGFDARGVLTLRLALPESDYPDTAATARFVNRLLERVRAVPQVVAAGTVTLLPLDGGGNNGAHTFEDFPLPPDAVPPILAYRNVTPDYFQAMGIPLVEGKTLDAVDPGRRSAEVVVSRALAERFWSRGGALGRRLTQGLAEDGRWATIVGVVGSVRDAGLHEKPVETVYYPLMRPPSPDGEDFAPRWFTLVVRTAGDDPLALAPAVREAIWSLDRNLPVARVRGMDQVMAESTARTSFTMLLLVIAAAMALLLGAVGNYGVISYVVSQRTREIGVRMALGARQRDVARMVVRSGLFVALAGVALGLAGALAVTRLMQALLFEVSPTDPATFGAVSALLVGIALLASYLPARRAAAVDPIEAIRCE
jgi:predicted permease